MTILRPPNAALGFNFGVGLQFSNTDGIADFRFEPQGASVFGHLSFLFQACIRLAEHQEAFLDKREILVFREFDVQTAAFERKVPQQFLSVGDVGFGGMLGEEPNPTRQRWREPWT